MIWTWNDRISGLLYVGILPDSVPVWYSGYPAWSWIVKKVGKSDTKAVLGGSLVNGLVVGVLADLRQSGLAWERGHLRHHCRGPGRCQGLVRGGRKVDLPRSGAALPSLPPRNWAMPRRKIGRLSPIIVRFYHCFIGIFYSLTF